MARIKYSTEEVDLLARLIKSEALGEGEQGMLLVGNVVINRVVANCDVFRNTRTITEVCLPKECYFPGSEPHSLTNQSTNCFGKLHYAVLTAIEMNRQLMPYGLKIPVTNVACPEKFYGNLSGRFKQHCFYNPGLKLNCDL